MPLFFQPQKSERAIKMDTKTAYSSALEPVWYMCLKTENCCLKTENCCLKTFMEIRVGEKVY